MRNVNLQYSDPLDLVWLKTAQRLGMKVERDADVFASWDGQSVLQLGTSETLDADDCLAQMIFHEICHAITEGPDSLQLEDWGLENDEPAHIVREHACLRLQATLAGKYGLRTFLATTTDFRDYYDKLPSDPLSPTDDPACLIAIEAFKRASEQPWNEPLHTALVTTQRMFDLVHPFADDSSLWSNSAEHSPASR